MNTQDEEILELSLNKLSQAMNRLIESCIDDSGKPKSPSMKELMQARAYLPSSCKMSFKKEL